MMPDCLGHGGVLSIRNPKLFGGLLHDPGQRSVMGMTHERTQMVRDVMVKPTREPRDERIFCRIIGRGREDVIHPIVKLTTIRWKVGAVDGVRRLEYESYGQSDDQMDQKERAGDQERRFSQHKHWQDKHVSEVKELTCKENDVFTQRVFGTSQISVGREEKMLEVSDEHIVERKHRVQE